MFLLLNSCVCLLTFLCLLSTVLSVFSRLNKCSLVRKHVTPIRLLRRREQFLMWRAWFFNGMRLAEIGPVDFGCCAHRDCTRRPLHVCWRHGGKCLESISHTSNSWNSWKNHVPQIGNRTETAATAISTTLANGCKRLDQPHPNQVCDLWDTPMLLDRFRLSEDGSVDFDLFHRKWCAKAVPHVAGVICWWIATVPVDFGAEQIGDCSGWPLLVSWCYGRKRLESIIHTSNSPITLCMLSTFLSRLFSGSTYCRLVHKHVPRCRVGQSNWVQLAQLSA